MIKDLENDTLNDTQTIPQIYPIYMIHVIHNGLHYTSMCLCPCISFARTLFLNALECLVFSRSVLQYGKVNVIPIYSHHDILGGPVLSGNSAFPNDTQNDTETIHQTILPFPFCQTSPFRTSMSLLLLSLLALACAGGQLCRCLCWLVVVLVDLVLVLLLCWWCRSGPDLVLVWCLVLLVWCLVSRVVVLVVVLLPLLLLLLLLLLLGAGAAAAAAGAGGSGGGGGGAAAAAAAASGGNVLVQAEVGRNHADVEFGCLQHEAASM